MKIYPLYEALDWKYGEGKWSASLDITTPALFSTKLKDDPIKLCKEYEDATSHIRSRLSEYPSIEEQLDQIYHKGIDAWQKNIKSIKDKYPKKKVKVAKKKVAAKKKTKVTTEK